jgi:hypothetical protein
MATSYPTNTVPGKGTPATPSYNCYEGYGVYSATGQQYTTANVQYSATCAGGALQKNDCQQSAIGGLAHLCRTPTLGCLTSLKSRLSMFSP